MFAVPTITTQHRRKRNEEDAWAWRVIMIDPQADTMVGPQADMTMLAWSLAHPLPAVEFPEPPTHRWSGVLKLVAPALAAIIGAVVIALMLRPVVHASSAGDSTLVVTTAPAAATRTTEPDPGPSDPEPFAMPTVMAQRETADGEYLTLMREGGDLVYDNATAIRFGHMICDYMWQTGKNAQVAAVEIYFAHRNSEPGNTVAGDLVQVKAAIKAYCPGLGS